MPKFGGLGQTEIRGTEFIKYPAVDGLLRLDAGGLDHLAPLLGFVGNELAELGRRQLLEIERAGKRVHPQALSPKFNPDSRWASGTMDATEFPWSKYVDVLVVAAPH